VAGRVADARIPGSVPRSRSEARKRFFAEDQELFLISKSFLVLFCKKELLALLP
jgi:hypothetical protein